MVARGLPIERERREGWRRVVVVWVAHGWVTQNESNKRPLAPTAPELLPWSRSTWRHEKGLAGFLVGKEWRRRKFIGRSVCLIL